MMKNRRIISAPKTDVQWKATSSYIEEIPQEDYEHAPQEAYEAFRDMKYGVRIHWGLYSM